MTTLKILMTPIAVGVLVIQSLRFFMWFAGAEWSDKFSIVAALAGWVGAYITAIIMSFMRIDP